MVGMLREHLLDLKAAGMPMLLCEQNAMFALRVADRGYVLDKGTGRCSRNHQGVGRESGRSAPTWPCRRRVR